MIRDTVKFVLIILLIVIPVRVYVAQPFIVNGASMDPTFSHGEYLIVDQISYRFNEPSRGDVVVFKYPNNERQFFIKRIVGLPGETVRITDTSVIIYNDEYPDGKELYEPYIKETANVQNGRVQETPLDSSEYFVLGDNRLESSDSRTWGSLKRHLIVGRPLMRLLPPSSVSLFPGLKEQSPNPY